MGRKRVSGSQGSLFEAPILARDLFPAGLLAQHMASFPFPEDLEAKRAKIETLVDSLKAGRLVKETAAQGGFLNDVFEEILGYKDKSHAGSGNFTLQAQSSMPEGGGAADAALGFFGRTNKPDQVLAPIELKGSDTDLDRPAGRGLTPVQQGWDYANKTPNCRWVIVSNYRETRLYHTSKTQGRFARFELEKLIEAEEFKRFYFCLCAENILKEETDSLLENLVREAALGEAKITGDFYRNYHDMRLALIDELRLSNRAAPIRLVLEKAQKLLDRGLFVAFAQSRGLLEYGTLQRVAQRRLPGRSRWESISALFDAIQKGDELEHISAYNGGLFAIDPDLAALHVPDTVVDTLTRLAAYDYNSDLDVDILGHVFEQSVSDIESLRKKHLLEDTDPKGGRRKKHGIVYTPAFITHFIFEKTVGRLIAEARARIDAEQPLNDAYEAGKKTRVAREYWNAYANWLESLRICDPACGSGAFLIAAYDALRAEYERVNKAFEGLGDKRRWDDPGEVILRNNLYGVDLAPESVEITKLSLWLKTARKGKKLVDLDAHVRCGNSLVDDKAIDPRAFNWKKTFPEVFRKGGFDVVLGNPPYVRIQNFSKESPEQAALFPERYKAAFKNYDLYVLFAERGLSLLKKDGILGFILPNKFFSADYGEGLRRVIAEEKALLEVVDLDRNQVFEGVTTYPALLFLRRQTPEALWYHLPDGTEVRDSLRLMLAGQGPAPAILSEGALSSERWTVRTGGEGALLDKLKSIRPTLSDVAEDIFQGLVTSADPVYILEDLGPEGEGFRRLRRPDSVYKGTKQSLPERTVVLEETFLKPQFRDGHVEPFFMAPPTHRIIFPYDVSGEKPMLISQKRFESEAPKTWGWLRDHEGLLRMREKGKMNHDGWWAYVYPKNLDALDAPKIIVPGFSEKQCFVYDDEAIHFTGRGDSGYGIRLKANGKAKALYVLGILNSNVAHFFQSRDASAFQGGYYSSGKRFLAAVPIPEAKGKAKKAVTDLVQEMIALKAERFRVLENGRHRLRVDVGNDAHAKLSKKLAEWPSLTFKELNDELFRLFKRQITPQDRAYWEKHLGAQRNAIQTLDAKIADLENTLNQKVYELFSLTEEEIAMVEGER